MLSIFWLIIEIPSWLNSDESYTIASARFLSATYDDHTCKSVINDSKHNF